MRKQYDDFTQLKLKDMSKSISDMTYRYINPDTQEPTKVPAVHYEKILDQVTEKYFNQALLCMDIGLNPKDLRINEQIAIEYIDSFINDKKNYEKKNFHFLSSDIIEAYDEAKSDTRLQTMVVRDSNKLEDIEDSMFRGSERER